MNKTELVEAVSTQAGVPPKTVASVFDSLADVVAVNVKKGEKVRLTGFAAFERVDRKARKARNPGTGEQIRVKASKGVRIAAGSELKRIVNGELPAPKLAKPATNGTRAATAAAAKTGATVRKTTRRTAATTTPEQATRERASTRRTAARRTAGV